MPSAPCTTHEARDDREAEARMLPVTRPIGATRRAAIRIAATAASTLLLCTAASTANADNSVARIGGKALDLVLVRPLKLGKIVFGFVTFIPAGLFAESPSGLWKDGWSASETAQAWDFFVADPFRETFFTPLGQVEY